MTEYITKDRAKQFVCRHCNEVCSEEPCEPSDCDWMAFIDKEPAADVVEVVRCKDCQHYYNSLCTNTGLAGTNIFMNPFDYCSYGAKMDKENNHERD